MKKYHFYLLYLVAIPGILGSKQLSLRVVSTECETTDDSLVKFDRCSVDKNAKNQMAWNVDLQLLQVVRTVEIEAKLLRKVNKKFQPFLYEDTVDLCDFLKRQQKRHIFWGRVYKMALKYSNLNHSCPFDHSIVIRDFLFDDDVFKALPFPRGHYLIDLHFMLNSIFCGILVI
uniref:Uncharacterized protein n=1 Tax=Musca domestica TaxID=7370 RepID=A0A1I8MX68_MUSDO